MGTLNIVFAVLGTIVLSFSLSNGQYTKEDMTVDIPDLGKILGRNATTTLDQGTNKPYIQFLGIPYGNIVERFSPSTLRDTTLNYTGEAFEALTAGMQCHQPNGIPQFMSEDCLYINVYTSKKYTGNDSELLPVIFFIHGGAFTVGAGSMFSPLRLLNRDIVYVTFNYRLGLAGFFSLQNENVPGNAAMYDVVNALKWTNKYIKYFGGNPDLVTISGQSAGSAAVTHLLVSKMAQGLFHRAIGASGSALLSWATTTNPMGASLQISNMTGCYDYAQVPDLTAIANCMRLLPPEVLVATLFAYQVSERQQGRLGFAVVSPLVQDFDMIVHPKFLPEHPQLIFERGDQANVPLMMGSTKHDGSYVLGIVYNRFLKDNGLENDPEFLRDEMVPSILQALGIDDYPGGIYESLAKTYLQDAYRSGDFNELYPGLMDLFSVFFFKGGCYNTALLHSRVNNTYWYSFDFRGQFTMFNSLFPSGQVPPFPGGVTHGDDLMYTHLLSFGSFNATENEVSTRMLDYWANFASTGNPTPETTMLMDWPELNETGHKYLSIDTESVQKLYYSDSWVGLGLETVVQEPSTPITPDPTSTEPTPGPTPVRITTTTSTEPNPSSDLTTSPPEQTTLAASAPTNQIFISVILLGLVSLGVNMLD